MWRRQNGHAALLEKGHSADVALLVEEIRSEIFDRAWPAQPDVRLVVYIPPVELEASDLKELLADLIGAALVDPQAIGSKAIVSGRNDGANTIFSVTSGRERAFRSNGDDLGRARAIVARNHGRLWLDQSGTTAYASFQKNGRG